MKYSIEDSTLKRIANSIRAKKGTTDKIKAEDFANEIGTIPTGGKTEPGQVVFNSSIASSLSRTEFFPLYMITKASFGEDTGIQLKSFNRLFSNMSNLTNINFSNLKGDNITDVGYMFYKCSSLEDIDLSFLSDYKITNFQYMFDGCTKLTNVDLSILKSCNPKSTWYMFNSCSKLETIKFPEKFINSNFTDRLNYMFYGTSKVRDLDLTDWNTSKVISMAYMFQNFGTSSHPSLDLSSFTGEAITDLSNMFAWSGVKKIDLRNFMATQSVNTQYWFRNCQYLEELYLDNFDFSKASSKNLIFSYCGTNTNTGKTKVYVKDETAREWILNLSTSNRPSTWSTENIIIAGSAEDTRIDI